MLRTRCDAAGCDDAGRVLLVLSDEQVGGQERGDQRSALKQARVDPDLAGRANEAASDLRAEKRRSVLADESEALLATEMLLLCDLPADVDQAAMPIAPKARHLSTFS
jgi:hypothetical protein